MNLQEAIDQVEAGMSPDSVLDPLIEDQEDLVEGFKSVIAAVVDKMHSIGDKLINKMQGTSRKGHREYNSLAKRYEGEVNKLKNEAEEIDDKAAEAKEKQIPSLMVSVGRLRKTAEYLVKGLKKRVAGIKKMLPDAIRGDHLNAVEDALQSANSTLSYAEKQLKQAKKPERV